MKQLLQKPVFWIILIIASFATGFIAYNYFDDAFSIMHIDLQMDRQQALEKTKEICKTQKLGPQEYDHASNFYTDSYAKTFIELAGGGKDELFNVMEQDLYHPYLWKVRHFKEYETNEVTVSFKPNGLPYGFIEKIADETPGEKLDKHTALAIAQEKAISDWNISLEHYTLLESSQETKTNGRIDHLFTYEHEHTLEDGRLRLKLKVTGDKLSQVEHFVHVPESFTRTYANMRSANNTIAWFAFLLMQLLYILGGCVLGLMFLSKKKYVLYKQAIFASIFLSFLLMLVHINNLPLSWFSYITSLGKTTFMLQYLLGLLVGFGTNCISFSIIFAAAESLTRKAFGTHPQLWRIWNTNAAATKDVLSITMLGYLLVPLLLCFVTLFYYNTTTYLGWWLPAGALINPNILSTYAPWFSSLVQSLQAGFVEECLFRAVPLSCAALLGKKYGNKNRWMFFAFILQIFVFAAAHANYPAQPAYARVIELIIPSVIFGLVYLFLGLLPAIISHVIFDVVWFALPIFSSNAPSAFINQVMIILGSALAFIMIIIAWFKKGTITNLSETFLNIHWTPPTKKIDAKMFTSLKPKEKHLATYVKCISGTLGIIGFLAWVWHIPKEQNGLPLKQSRNEVITFANELFKNDVTDTSNWSYMTKLEPKYPITKNHRFVWQELGMNAYKKLLGTYIPAAQWHIRYAQFEGDLLERAEEFTYTINNKRITQKNHILPEQANGRSLSENIAKNIALKEIESRFGIISEHLEEVSAKSIQKPNRLDWIFTFKDKTYPFVQGQAHNIVYISGDTVTNAFQTMHIPQTWQRKEQERNAIAGITRAVCYIGTIIVVLTGTVIAWYMSTGFATGSFLLLALLLIILSLFDICNNLPNIFILFSTQESWYVQLIRMLTNIVLGKIAMSVCLAYLITLVRGYTTKYTLKHSDMNYFLAFSFGVFIAAAKVIVMQCVTQLQPLWPSYETFNSYIPYFAQQSTAIQQYLSVTVIVLLFAICVHFFSCRLFKIHPIIMLIPFVKMGIVLFGLQATYNIQLLTATGTICGFIAWFAYYFLLRYDFALLPAMTFGYFLLHMLAQDLLYSIFGIGTLASIVYAISWVWYKNNSIKQLPNKQKI